MNNILIRLAVLMYLIFIAMVTADIWRRKRISSNWNFQIVRKLKDKSLEVESVISQSLIGCSTACTYVDGSMVPSLYFTPGTGECVCNSAVDNTSEDTTQPESVYGTRLNFLQIELTDNSRVRTTVWPYRHDCSELHDVSYHEDGVYVIHPPGGYLTDAWCDMTKGGWTVVQRRIDGSENFYRGWNDYVMGFGNRTGEYWLGLENIYHLTKDGSRLFIYMEQYSEVTPPNMSAYYSHFKIGDLASNFALDISGFTGTCGDSMAKSNRQSFTTYDNDNDRRRDKNCAVTYVGAWWYNDCHSTNLNGLYYREGQYSASERYGTGIHWGKCWHHKKSSKFALMEIKH